MYKLYLEEFENIKDAKGESSLINWVSCKICTGEKNQIIKDDKFFNTLCSSLKIKLNKQELFDVQETSVKQFKKKLVPETEDNLDSKTDNEGKMTKEEKAKLFAMVHVTRRQLKLNLHDSEKTEGSDEFKMNLALYAFERDLADESLSLVESLADSGEFKDDIGYLQLHAKLLSNLQSDDEAIEVLELLVEKQKPLIDVESYNLLAASIKRKALHDFFNVAHKNNDNIEILLHGLIKSKDIYSSIFNINKDYYPAINIIYLQMMLAYIQGGNKRKLEIEKAKIKELWNNSNINNELEKNNWWACISDVEFLILTTDYEKALIKLEEYMHDLNEEEMSDFNISSTIRQVELYEKICTDVKLGEFIVKLKDINNKKHLSKYIKKT